MKFRKVKPKMPGSMGPMVEAPSKPKPYYPSISIPIEALPEAKKWEIGQTYTVGLQLKQKGLHVHDENSGSAEFDIVGIAVESNGGKKRVPRYKV